MNEHPILRHAHGEPRGTAVPATAGSLEPCPAMIGRLLARRSPPLRSLAEPGPSADELALMLRLAIRTPDHGRLAPWRFILVEGEARAQLGARLDALYARQNPDMAAGKDDMWQLYLMRAPLTVILVSRPDRTAKVPEWNQALSAGAVGMALTVAASALGFASQWLLKWPGRDAEAAALLGVGPEEKVAGFFHIGRPTQTTPDRPRPVPADVVSRWAP